MPGACLLKMQCPQEGSIDPNLYKYTVHGYPRTMTDNLFPQTAPVDFAERAVSPKRELGAYEALWARDGTWFKSIAEEFRAHPGAVPSDFVSDADIEKYSRLALGAIRDAGIKHFCVRIHGAGDYPPTLRDAEHPVELLYFQGLWDLVNTRCVAIVGTRHASEEGKRRTAKLARLFVADGFTVVSGLARGIDTVAHETAIGAGGFTIAVLGTPLSECYPPENRELQRHIADKHLVISQVPIVRYSKQHYRANRFFFPERNATMSALTEATVIVEAGQTSGTLVQARHALQQRRKLFILDNCFRVPSLTWPARFAEQGAIRVSDYEEIKSHLAASDTREITED
jgi:DNA processing protein